MTETTTKPVRQWHHRAAAHLWNAISIERVEHIDKLAQVIANHDEPDQFQCSKCGEWFFDDQRTAFCLPCWNQVASEPDPRIEKLGALMMEMETAEPSCRQHWINRLRAILEEK